MVSIDETKFFWENYRIDSLVWTNDQSVKLGYILWVPKIPEMSLNVGNPTNCSTSLLINC